ncbi:hypothetical protein JTE90_014180 [Oedothorax gibbosus]|uniref:RNA-directed DNA polymerase n=1 Tax=Oedothorax gibbosus TaxID=931172 RepID=A0AAV6VLL7_9ARAC|nr:hypothetical protein JTE90_014180 [Oedothorax gibbosus]
MRIALPLLPLGVCIYDDQEHVPEHRSSKIDVNSLPWLARILPIVNLGFVRICLDFSAVDAKGCSLCPLPSVTGSVGTESSEVFSPAIDHDMFPRSGVAAPPLSNVNRVALPQRCLPGKPTSAFRKPVSPGPRSFFADGHVPSPREICTYMIHCKTALNLNIDIVQDQLEILDTLGPNETASKKFCLSELGNAKSNIICYRSRLNHYRACPIPGCKLKHSWNTDFQVSMEPAVQSPIPPASSLISISHPSPRDSPEGFKTVSYKKRKPVPKGTSSPISQFASPPPTPALNQEKTEHWIKTQNSFAPLGNQDVSEFLAIDESTDEIDEPPTFQPPIMLRAEGMGGIKVFMDDVRVTGSSELAHFEALSEFFKKCKEHGLKLNLQKSKFFKKEINFLGHKIDANGLHKTDEKISAIAGAPKPKNAQEVQSFLGLVQFYGKFCSNLATIANPLNNLTKKNTRFIWSKDCQKSFQNIKEEICSPQVLVHYDPALPVMLATDASPVGLGAVLSHKMSDGTERPIAFASRTMTDTEKKYSQIDKEALAIVWAVKKFYLYLKGRRFTLITDHKPPVAIFGCKKGLPVLAATRLLHYALTLQSFQFDIIYRNTKEHGNADFLSRLPGQSEDLEVKDDVTLFQLQQIENLPVTAEELAKGTQADEELGPLFLKLQRGGELRGREAEYSLQDGCIMYGTRVMVPKQFQRRVLEELHHGHLGVVKMKAIARSFVVWTSIDRDIEDTAKNCIHCAEIKTDPHKAKVHYWEYPSKPWERIHIDFAGPMFGYMFLVIVDAHSKWLEVYPMKSTTTFKTIESLRDCFARFGLPVTLVSDNGPQFTSHEFKTFMNSNGIKHKTTAPFKPSSNGQAELHRAFCREDINDTGDNPKLNIVPKFSNGK